MRKNYMKIAFFSIKNAAKSFFSFFLKLSGFKDQKIPLVCLFQTVCLLFLAYIPTRTLIPARTFIPDSRVHFEDRVSRKNICY